MNPFETGSRKVIPAVLIYCRRDSKTLMLHRNSRPDDYHLGKWNGLGGKCEADESFAEAARRELAEEAGLELAPEAFCPLGILQFPNFKPHRSEDWIVTVFSVDVPREAEPVADCPEGALEWIEDQRLLELKLWAGDREFLPYVVERRPFVGTIWYEGERVRRHAIHDLGQGGA